MFRNFIGALVGFAALLAVAGEGRAALLGLTPGSPDISSGFIDTDYDSGTDIFTSSGFAFDLDGALIGGGWFDISAIIDDTGTAVGGTLSIGGTLPSLGFNSGTLLTGTLSDFGFPDGGGDPLEFLFDVTGGDAAGLYGPTAGVVLSFSGFGGSFSGNFASAPFGGSSETFAVTAVPEPATLAIFGVGLAGLGFMRRRRKMAHA